MILNNKKEHSSIHIPEKDGVLYDEVIGLSYPVLEDEDYPFIGDVNKDRNIDFSDVSELLNHVLKGTVNDYHKTVAHFDTTKENVTANDVAILIKQILKQK